MCCCTGICDAVGAHALRLRTRGRGGWILRDVPVSPQRRAGHLRYAVFAARAAGPASFAARRHRSAGTALDGASAAPGRRLRRLQRWACRLRAGDGAGRGFARVALPCRPTCGLLKRSRGAARRAEPPRGCARRALQRQFCGLSRARNSCSKRRLGYWRRSPMLTSCSLVLRTKPNSTAVRARAPVPNACAVLPRQPRCRMAAFTELASVLVSPRSHGSNFPLKIFDYLAAGKPIVATDVPAHRAVLDNSLASARAIVGGCYGRRFDQTFFVIANWPSDWGPPPQAMPACI